MKAYKITSSEKESLGGQKMESGGYFNPVQDINGDWFIFEVEHQACDLGVEADFNPPPTEELI
jgi:hypothetical protein